VSIFTIIAKIIGLIPSAAEAGRAIAKAFESKSVNPDNSLLWHTATYGRRRIFCTVCQQYVDRQNELCTEAVRRHTQN
jgi:hypothetical protein